ncbi:MAG: rod shape-determining protein RodA [Rickettsiaceae bacterium]
MIVTYAKHFLEKMQRLPITLLLIIIALFSIGCVALYSTANYNPTLTYIQIQRFCIFLPLMLILSTINLKMIFRYSYLIYFIALILLIAVEILGHISMGAKRWINLGVLTIQPSEVMKIALVLIMARYFHQLRYDDISKIRKILPIAILTVIPILLIAKEPDLGTAIISMIVVSTVFFAAGVSILYFIISILSVLISLPILWNMLYDYQKNRILAFLDPTIDPFGIGYNIIQSKIAIGSGKVLGKGIMSGTQNHLLFLPEHKTDFIFAAFAEEFGLIGIAVLLLLYSLVIIVSILISLYCKSTFAKLMAIGMTSIFFSHVFINIAMVVGVIPATGVPLPFMSYGGSSLASMLISMGLIFNAHIHRYYKI